MIITRGITCKISKEMLGQSKVLARGNLLISNYQEYHFSVSYSKRKKLIAVCLCFILVQLQFWLIFYPFFLYLNFEIRDQYTFQLYEIHKYH